MKKEKLLFLVLLFLSFMNFALASVFALTPSTETKSFDFTIGPLSYGATGSISPDEDIAFSLVEVTNYSGSARYNVIYQTYYSSSWVDIGAIQNNNNEYDFQFHPAMGFLGWGDKEEVCSGSNTSSYNCMLEGESYRIKMKNNNLLFSFTVEGIFYGYE